MECPPRVMHDPSSPHQPPQIHGPLKFPGLIPVGSPVFFVFPLAMLHVSMWVCIELP